MKQAPRLLAGSRVLVTGAGGFVGPHLARALVARGASVEGLGLGGSALDPAFSRDWSTDITSTAALTAVLAQVQPAAIVHLAGQSSAALSFEQPEATFRANVIGTWSVLEAVRQAVPAARVLVVGTSEVYGPCAEGTRVREDQPFAPVSPYALSKAAADHLAEAMARAHALDVVRARPFGHTGPGQTARFMLPAFAQQIAAIEAGGGEPVLRVGNLEVTRDLSDVRDIVEGYADLLEHGQPGAAYHLCRGEGVRLTDLVARLAAMARVEVRVEVDASRLRPADVPWLVGDPSRIAHDTGWSVRRSLDTTLADTLADWRRRSDTGGGGPG